MNRRKLSSYKSNAGTMTQYQLTDDPNGPAFSVIIPKNKKGITARPDIEKILNDVKLKFYVEMALAHEDHPDGFVWEYYIDNRFKTFERIVIRPLTNADDITIYMYCGLEDHKETQLIRTNMKLLKAQLENIVEFVK